MELERIDADKEAAKKQWNSTPCGSTAANQTEYGSIGFFDAVRRSRYEVSDQWMKRVIPFAASKGKCLLEIGHGIGSDLLTFSEAGAEVHGIDITQEHNRLASRNFELHQRPVTLKLCDAAHIDYPDNFFDIVYSNGVLHHTPDTIRCISEAFRVLKPGGMFVLSLYHTWSAFHIFSVVLYNGVLKRKVWTLGYKGLMSTVETGADGITIKPLVKTYSRRELRTILQDFSKVNIQVAHFDGSHIPYFGKIIPNFLARRLESLLGWYVIAIAQK
jgi:ubiquinone/menaquinone biosynthesis C-methylase UbiE